MRKFTRTELKALYARYEKDRADDQPTSLEEGDYIIRKQPNGLWRAWINGRDWSGTGNSPAMAIRSAHLNAFNMSVDMREAAAFLKTFPKTNRLENVTDGFY